MEYNHLICLEVTFENYSILFWHFYDVLWKSIFDKANTLFTKTLSIKIQWAMECFQTLKIFLFVIDFGILYPPNFSVFLSIITQNLIIHIVRKIQNTFFVEIKQLFAIRKQFLIEVIYYIISQFNND